MSKSKARNLADLLGGTGSAEFQGESGIILPDGTTSQRPNPATVGTARYNTDIGKNEVYDSDGWTAIAPPPVVTSVSPTSVNESDTTQTIVITGQKFDVNATALMLDSNGTAITPTTSTRNSSSQITITYSGGDIVTNPNEPYDVKVVNGTGLSAILEDAVSFNETPDWSTTSGTVANVVEDEAMTSVQLSATDPEGSSVSYSVTSGALPTGLSLSSSGLITGTPNVSDTYSPSGVTHNFTVAATDGTNTTSRAFNIIRKWRDGSSSSLAATSADEIKQLTGTTTTQTYWININNTPTEILCDMDGTYTNSSGSGRYDSTKGYMLYMSFGSNSIQNGISHTRVYNPDNSTWTAAGNYGLTTDAAYFPPNGEGTSTNADALIFYSGGPTNAYVAQTNTQFDSAISGLGFTPTRLNIKVGHPYSTSITRTYINGITQSPDLSATDGVYNHEADLGSYTWKWFVQEGGDGGVSISSIYYIFIR
jgi:hypothetical protein